MTILKKRFWRKLTHHVLGSGPSNASRAEAAWAQEGSFRSRHYDSYEQYREHQRSKLATLEHLQRYGEQFRPALRARLEASGRITAGMSVLCLGARSGAECRAFIELGCFAVGIDLNPGSANEYVLTGDFHHLQFADRSVDCVYTNALDHAFALDKVLAEVARVLKPEGIFIAELVLGPQEEGGREPGKYESTWWESSDAVVAAARQTRFGVLGEQAFETPWAGRQVIFGPGSPEPPG